MSVRLVLAVAGTASVQPTAADAYDLTAGRLVGTVAALVALAGVVAGGLALARPATGRRGAMVSLVSLVSGLTGMVIGALNLAVADGGPGTGNGVVGGAIALVTGLIATTLGALALSRARRTRATT